MKWLLGCGGIVLALTALGWAEKARAAEAPGYPQSIEEEIRSLVAAGADQSSDPVFLLRLAELYLDAGDDLYKDKDRRRRAYEEGAKVAWRALELQDLDPQAHYLYAANLGSAANLKGIMASALTVRALKRHVAQAIELDPTHAQALHMMGMLLEELPALLGGDSDEAVIYLRRAVEVDPSYTHARLNLAKVYLDREDFASAEAQLRAILATKEPRNAHAWAHRHKPEAQALLASLEERGHPTAAP